ncbi:glycosyltransferase 52 family protein [Vibrio sp. 05-20-BW147]|uniref:glycosyltransferase 52 family protein n=1 Tax=Vibrio sp. 05-20-BW147 TaxID=2575834 RepID=UPI001593E7B7|nr:glycosyltransferase 52 family protein [Vibrio sp. 05-20-BW147]NVC64600.1 glycosyltransferase 52 family protein [Vibrio sp. 05-20-BW147]
MNVFLITSPFQYICANEARLTYHLEENILIYVEQESETGIRQMKRLFEEDVWQHIIRIPRSNRTFHVPSAIKKVKRLLGNKSVKNFVFSEYYGWRSNLFLANLNAEHYIYIDDGTSTLLEYDDFILPNKAYTRKRIIQDALIRLQGLKPPQHQTRNDKLELFSIFEFNENKVAFRKNNLDGLKKLIHTKNVYHESAPVGLIGQACVGEKRGISIDTYIEELSRIAESEHRGIVYFPHRTESETVKSKVLEINNLTYHQPSSPIELEIALSGQRLSGITGVTSNALYTVSLIYQDLPIQVIGGELKGNNDRDARVRSFLNGYFKNYRESNI